MNSDTIRAILEEKPDFVIKNANIVNVFTEEIVFGDVGIYNGIIIGIGKYDCANSYDAKGAYLTPGFIDSHVHIESSMVTPSEYMKLVMPHGTTTVIADPHEIANVAGLDGIDTMYSLAKDLPLRIRYLLSSCVPATSFERSGAVIAAKDMKEFLNDHSVLGLAEVMDFPSVIAGAPDMQEKLALFVDRLIDGHSPMLSGAALNAYIAAGPDSDHECSSYAELREKLSKGMKILLRLGSAACNLEDMLIGIVRDNLPTENMLFCTDDKHIEDISRTGHINANARLAVKCGIPPIKAVKIASYNAARAYGLKRVGAIAPGYASDMVLFRDLNDFEVIDVFTRFGTVYDPGAPLTEPSIPNSIRSSVHINPLSEKDLELRCKETAPVISLIGRQLVNKLEYRQVKRDSLGRFVPSDGLLKIAVTERHFASGKTGVGIIEGYPIKGGAVASTVSHDSHNLVIVGDNDRDMLIAANALAECGGGYAVVKNGTVASLLPLPVAGLMSDASAEDIVRAQHHMLDTLESMGADRENDGDPMIALSFLALPVIPEARITPDGLYNVMKGQFLSYSDNND